MLTIELWFTLGAVGMAFGTLLLAMGLRAVPKRVRRRYTILVSVPGIAVIAYALMALGIGGVTTPSGSTLYIPRYVDWLLTTPLHVVYLGLLAGVGGGLLLRLAGLQALTILFGLVGGLAPAPLNWAGYAAGLLAFAAVIYAVLGTVDDCARGTDQYALFRQLRAFLIALWLVYPLIWMLGGPGFGVVDVETASLVVSYLDVVSKVGFGLIALNGWMTATTAVSETKSTAD
jgi:sensory rhodopsin